MKHFSTTTREAAGASEVSSLGGCERRSPYLGAVLARLRRLVDPPVRWPRNIFEPRATETSSKCGSRNLHGGEPDPFGRRSGSDLPPLHDHVICVQSGWRRVKRLRVAANRIVPATTLCGSLTLAGCLPWQEVVRSNIDKTEFHATEYIGELGPPYEPYAGKHFEQFALGILRQHEGNGLRAFLVENGFECHDDNCQAHYFHDWNMHEISNNIVKYNWRWDVNLTLLPNLMRVKEIHVRFFSTGNQATREGPEGSK